MTDPCLHLAAVSLAYGGKTVVSDVTLSLTDGAIGCLLGPSGCGKTSLLRAIAGFEPVSAGTISLKGAVISRPGLVLPPEKRSIGMVFQDFALFPHLSVADNIGFGLRRWAAPARQDRVSELLALIGLPGLGARFPHELSGGQQQRIALARAMAPRPAILLMDEPFSAIDPDFREQLAGEVREMIRRDGMTAILVTHDQSEAFAMADQIAVLHQGAVQQVGTPYQLYHQPANRHVAAFIGDGVLLSGSVSAQGQIQTLLGPIPQEANPLASHAPLSPGDKADILIRPHDITLCPPGEGIPLTVRKVDFRGPSFRYLLEHSDGSQVLFQCQTPAARSPGETVHVKLADHKVVIFSQTGQALTP